MQCWKLHADCVFGRARAGRAPSRRPALLVLAKMKYKANIAQNHARKSAWTNFDYDRLYTQPSYSPGRQVGPVKLQPLPGRGRGLVAEREIPSAETVLLSEPVGAALTGPEGAELRPQHLVDYLAALQQQGALGPAERARLRLLDDGSPSDSPAALRNRLASLDDFRKLEDKLKRSAETVKKAKGKGFGAPAAATGPAAGQAGTSSINAAQLGEAPLEPEELTRLADFNSWGNSFGELGATQLRREASRAIIGIWPEFALMNHSCAPNTTTFAVGQHLLVQTTRDVPKGEELTTCYLGELVLAPLERRREWLRGSYGFECACERCTAEAAAPPAVAAAVEAAYALATGEETRAVLEAATGRSDREALRPLEAALGEAVERLEGAMETAGLEAPLRAWLRASAYDAYHARAALRDLPDTAAGNMLFGRGSTTAPFSDPSVPTELTQLVAEVAAGSDLHLYLTLEALSRSAEAFPRDDPRVIEATKTYLRAHILRYGRTSDAVLRELLQARSTYTHYLGRVSLPSQQQPQLQQEGEQADQQANAGSLTSQPVFGSSAWVAASPVQLREAAEAAAADLAALQGSREDEGKVAA